MFGATLMAREKNARKKSAEDAAKEEACRRPSPDPAKEETTQIRVRKAFKKRLHSVAIDIEKDMGDLIEEQLEEFLDREEARIEAEKQADRARRRGG